VVHHFEKGKTFSIAPVSYVANLCRTSFVYPARDT